VKLSIVWPAVAHAAQLDSGASRDMPDMAPLLPHQSISDSRSRPAIFKNRIARVFRPSLFVAVQISQIRRILRTRREES